MSLAETKYYRVVIILTTEKGELPTDHEVEELIAAQMSGELDDTTGLFCASVKLVSSGG